MKLYEFAPTRSIRVRWVLQELGVEFEAISINMRARVKSGRYYLTETSRLIFPAYTNCSAAIASRRNHCLAKAKSLQRYHQSCQSPEQSSSSSQSSSQRSSL
ncbi:hypothetical protein [Nostoc sp.]|uniref:hypothetical protein n=1 Tax=Nostoc sp. TaxID=1180 RepID=UPI002FFD18F3